MYLKKLFYVIYMHVYCICWNYDYIFDHEYLIPYL